MRHGLINALKYNRAFYAIYYHVASVLVNALKLFVKPDDELILFNSFAGRKFDDSPKVIFEEMKADHRFERFKMVWAFHEPELFVVEGATKIRTDGFTYFKTALKARVWVTNSSVERGLRFKGKRTFYLNTWHGTPIKFMGTDVSDDNMSFKAKGSFGDVVDVMMSQGHYETDIFSRTFGIPKDRFLEAGLPRNDVLHNYTEEQRCSLRHEMKIGDDQIVVLYCPTFREYDRNGSHGVKAALPIDFGRWETALGERYVVLFRAHYEVSKTMEVVDSDFVRDVTDYPRLNDLMIVSDLLVSDYSSIFFDYSITGRPMLCFAYDYDRYARERGMYFDVREFVSGSATEDGLLELIRGMDAAAEAQRTVAFRERFVDYYGNAGRAAVDRIAKVVLRDGLGE